MKGPLKARGAFALEDSGVIIPAIGENTTPAGEQAWKD